MDHPPGSYSCSNHKSSESTQRTISLHDIECDEQHGQSNPSIVSLLGPANISATEMLVVRNILSVRKNIEFGWLRYYICAGFIENFDSGPVFELSRHVPSLPAPMLPEAA